MLTVLTMSTPFFAQTGFHSNRYWGNSGRHGTIATIVGAGGVLLSKIGVSLFGFWRFTSSGNLKPTLSSQLGKDYRFYGTDYQRGRVVLGWGQPLLPFNESCNSAFRHGMLLSS